MFSLKNNHLNTNENNYAAFSAIAWADQKHGFSLQAAGQTKKETATLAQKAIELLNENVTSRLAPRLLACFGTDRSRYEKSESAQCFSGIVPVTKSSGKTKVAHFRQACPRFVRQTFHEFARLSVAQCQWAENYVAYYMEKGENIMPSFEDWPLTGFAGCFNARNPALPRMKPNTWKP